MLQRHKEGGASSCVFKALNIDHFHPAVSNWRSQSVGIHSLNVSAEIHHAAASTHILTLFPLETLSGGYVVVVVVGAICTGFVVSKGNKHFHHGVVPLLFKMISGRH